MDNNSAPFTSSSQNLDANATNQSLITRIQSCFSIETYKKYFDVDTVDIQSRIVDSVQHANVPVYFREQVLGTGNSDGKSPDLYGPFWITMTLDFLFAVTSNKSKYLHADSMADFSYDISNLVHAVTILTFCTFLFPTALYIVFVCLGITQITLVELLSLYGYSLVPYLPAAALCLIPVAFFEWLFLLAASAVSALLILRNIAGPVLRSQVVQRKAGPVLICVMGCHLIFFLVLKLTFYHYPRRHRKRDNF